MSNFTVNKKREESRSIYLKSNPIVGLLALTGFTDDANSPIGSRKFIKTFRYTTNGVIYSQWIPLTVDAITDIHLDPKDVFIIEIAYNKNEPIGTSQLNVDSAVLAATTSMGADTTPFFDQSMFKRYFDADDVDALNWYVNVLEKLWEKGLIPNYMDRDFANPDDFLQFWGSVTKFCAYYVVYARTFATFYNRIDLLREFLGQRGLQTSPEDSLDQLQNMLQTFYRQIAARGTNEIVKDEQDGVEDIYGASLNGELRRFIHYKDIDEFMFCLYRPENYGWCLGHSSPLYTGLRVNDNLNKAPWSKGLVSMVNVPVSPVSAGAVIQDLNVVGVPFVAQINDGTINTSATPIKVSSSLDYEISFQVRLYPGATISLGVTAYDANGNAVTNKNRRTGSATNVFFTNAIVSRDNEYVTVKCYLYNKDRGTFNKDTTSIRQGNNLIADAALQSITLQLHCVGQALIYDFRIIPMRTEYSRGFLQSANLISAWFTNRNTQFSKLELEDYIKRYLINYNQHIQITGIGDYLYTSVEQDIDSTYWVGAGEYCQKVVWIGINPACEVQTLIWVPEEETAYCEQVITGNE